MDDGIFRHKCTEDGCPRIILFDDEPKCFQHYSPDSGSSVRGYSARKEADRLAELAGFKDFGTALSQYHTLQMLMNDVGHHA